LQCSANSDSKLTETIHNDQLRDKILQWISSSDFPSEQSDLISQRQEGTGLWFLVSQEFDQWRDESKQTLFCPGMPGAGKTMIAAMTIDHLSKTIRSRSAGLAYVFCNYKTQTSQNATSLLAAILKQLVQDQPTIPAHVLRLYREHYPRGTNMSFEDCVGALESVSATYPTVHIIVDALDECSGRNDATRNRLLTAIFDLQRTVDVRLMVTSRPIPDIVQYFHGFPSIEIRATTDDVQQFVTDQMSRLPRCVRGNEDLKALVQNKVVEAADGMLVCNDWSVKV
jgi:Cdc6-like AAA superfamily ATPase